MDGAILTQERLHEVLDYSPFTGDFVWKVQRGLEKAGVLAGSVSRTGYLVIHIDRKRYRSHRLAWLYVHGKWPNGTIDHIDGDKMNNRIGNLREATVAENNKNRRLSSANTTGYKGVSYDAINKRFRAGICVGGKNKNLGRFDSAEAAHKAYKEASLKYHGAFGSTK